MRKVCVLLILAFVAGCAHSPGQFDICKPTNLSSAQLEGLKNCVAEAEFDGPGPFATGSFVRRWVPTIFLRDKHTVICRGRMPYVESMFLFGENYSRPSYVDSVGQDEEWIYARDLLGIGPLSCLYWRDTEAAFDMQGRNFVYEREHMLMAGILWRHRYTIKRHEKPKTEMSAGLFFTAFGYGQRTAAGQMTTTVRVLWIPIPIKRRTVLEEERAKPSLAGESDAE